MSGVLEADCAENADPGDAQPELIGCVQHDCVKCKAGTDSAKYLVIARLRGELAALARAQKEVMRGGDAEKTLGSLIAKARIRLKREHNKP